MTCKTSPGGVFLFGLFPGIITFMKPILKQPKNSFAPLKLYLALFGVTLALHLFVALFLQQPGYIDAYYYYDVAANFHAGRGLTTMSLWNYQLDSQSLDNIQTARPAFGYWLPLATMLIIGSFAIFGTSFLAAQLPFILLAALLPPLAFWLGRLAFGVAQRRYSWTMALAMVFPGRYFVYLNSPDNFAPFAVILLLGLICIYLGMWQQKGWAIIAAGILSGLAYLSRSDGVLLLATLLICFGWRRWQLRRDPQTSRPGWLNLGVALLAAFLSVAPWLWRNLNVFGTLLPTGSTKVLFLRNYQELFSYGLPLDFSYYVNQTLPASDWGSWPLLGTKFTALWLDVVILAIEGLFLFGPLFLVGLFLLRKRAVPNSYRPFGVYLGLFYVVMVLVFTLVGEHGTVFHSAGGLLPFQAGAAVAAIDALTNFYGVRRRQINLSRLRNGLLGLCLIINSVLTLYVGYSEGRGWDDAYNYSRQVGQWFLQHKLDSDVIMVGEPLSFRYANGLTAIPLASDGVEANLAAARRYGAKWLELGQVHYSSLDKLYEQKTAPGLVLVTTLPNGTEIYQIN